MRHARIAAALAASALVLAACGDDDATGPSPTTASVDTGAPAGWAALDFVAPDVRGGEVVGAELAGQELVIWFWAPW